MSIDPDSERRHARRAEVRRRQVRRRRIGGVALLVAVAGVGIWAAATLASGSSDERSADSVETTTITAGDANSTASALRPRRPRPPLR